MEAKHTPGPWHLWHDAEGAFEITAAGPKCIVRRGRMGSPQEGIANAHLISAAPDLFHAANGLLGLIQLLQARSDWPHDADEALAHHHRIEDARAAIAKARGEG